MNQCLVARLRFGRRVAEIRQQREVQMLIPVREVMNLQGLDQAIHARHAREHRGHDDHRAAIRRNAGGKIQARKQAGIHQQGGQPVHQRHGQLARAQQKNQREENHFPALHIQRQRLPHKSERGQQRQQTDSAGVKCQRKAVDAALNRGLPRPADFGQPREFGPAFVDQIKTNVGGAIAFDF